MAEADIRVNIRWIDRGARQGAQQAQQSVRALGEAQRTAALQAIQLTQRIGAAANAIQSLTSRLGGSGSAAGLIGAFANSAAAGAQLGSALGPQGALVGGIVGALIPALEHLVPATEAAEDRMRRLDAAARAAAQGVRQAAAEAARQSSLSELLGRGIEGVRAEDLDTIERALVDTRARRAEIEAQIASEMRTGGREAADALERQHAAELRLLQSQEHRLSSMRNVAQELARVRAEDEASQRAAREEVERDRAAVQAEMELLEEQQRRREQARQRATERIEHEREAWERLMSATERAFEQRRQAREYVLDLFDEELEAMRARKEAEQEAIEQAEQKRTEALAAEIERMRELGEEQRRIEEMRREAAIRTGREVMSATEEIVGGIIDTFAAIESGQKTAEEAYKALLARFLAFIAEKAALKALDEAAESIAAYARYDYSAGSQHAAAAVAFGALAVAAGVGSAVAGPKAAPLPGQSADARGIGDREERGGTVVIEWNAPTVTAQTRAELGRSLDRMVNAGRRRFGTVR